MLIGFIAHKGAYVLGAILALISALALAIGLVSDSNLQRYLTTNPDFAPTGHLHGHLLSHHLGHLGRASGQQRRLGHRCRLRQRPLAHVGSCRGHHLCRLALQHRLWVVSPALDLRRARS